MLFFKSFNMSNSLISFALIVLIGLSGSFANCIDNHGNIGEIHPIFADCNSHACESSIHSCDTTQCDHNSCSDKHITSFHTTQRIRGHFITNDVVPHSYNSIRCALFSSLIKIPVSFNSPSKYLHKQRLLVLRI